MSIGLRTANALLVALLTAVMPACRTGISGGKTDDTGAVSQPIDLPISNQQAKLLASGGHEFDTLGTAVAVSGNTALVGTFRDDELGTDAGAVYVFVHGGAGWSQQARLTAADGGANANFGTSVALDGDTAVVGAIFDGEAASAAGALYVFVRSGTTWTQQAKLTAADAGPEDQLGVSVALAGDTAVAGTINRSDSGDHSGAAYVFVRGGTTWTQQAKLTAADAAAGDQLGTSVALAGDTALIGAPFHGDLGAAYLFVRTGASWTQQARLTADDAAAGDRFGSSAALAGDTALIGAPFHSDLGAAYLFVRTGTSWTQQAGLAAADGDGGDRFGASAALAGDTAVIGAPFSSPLGAASGSAYVFGRSGTSWTQQARLTAADGESVDLFGTAVAVSGATAVIGAPGDDDLGNSSGAAYVFTSGLSPDGDACATAGECESGFCADGVCCNTACGGGASGDCQACSVAAGAAVDGTCAPRSAGTVCRAAAGACDVAETCTGTSTACPSDALATAGSVCRAAAGACDVAETCTGSSASCPADTFTTAGSVCRPAAGACDAAETCTGTSASCPTDAFVGAGNVCRPAAGSCDLRETCTGSSGSCPRNQFKPDLSLCFGGLLGLPGVCLAGVCVL